MITQEFDINIVPHGLPPRVAINQYDTGLRTLIAHVYQDDVSIPMTSFTFIFNNFTFSMTFRTCSVLLNCTKN